MAGCLTRAHPLAEPQRPVRDEDLLVRRDLPPRPDDQYGARSVYLPARVRIVRMIVESAVSQGQAAALVVSRANPEDIVAQLGRRVGHDHNRAFLDEGPLEDGAP